MGTYSAGQMQIFIAKLDNSVTFNGLDQDSLYICNPITETGVTTPSRFNLYDGKIHKVHASWENNYATIGIDNNWTGNPSTTIVSSTDIPSNLSRIEVGRGTISNVKTFNKTHGRK